MNEELILFIAFFLIFIGWLFYLNTGGKNQKFYKKGETFKDEFGDYFVQDIEKFLLENTRVLKPGGLFLFSSHVITNLVKPFEPILKIADKNHPYHFTLDEMVSIFKNCGLRMKRHAVVPLYLEEKIPQETNILQKAKYFLGFHILHTLYGVIEKKA